MVDIYLQAHTVRVPGIVSHSPHIMVMSSDYMNDHRIDFTDSFVWLQCTSIIREEMRIAREKNTDIDWDKIQEMVNSSDSEMRNLAYEIISKDTKYTARLLECIYRDDKYSSQLILSEYGEKNCTNITGKIL